jgi:hypothetical protein
VLLLAAGALAACTAEPEPVTPITPGGSSSSSSSAAPETSGPSETATASALEDDPAVQALRGYLAGYAEAVNNGGNPDIPQVEEHATPEQVERVRGNVQDEIGLEYPGPVPFGVDSLATDTEARKDVVGCLVLRGYAEDPATGAPRDQREVVPAVAVMENRDGTWLANGIYTENLPATADCASVEIEEGTW